MSTVYNCLKSIAHTAQAALLGVAPTVKKVAAVMAALVVAQPGLGMSTPTQCAEGSSSVALPSSRSVFASTYPLTEENHLPFKYQFMESTDYIDGIKPEDMKESVMWGIDARGRSFFAVKVFCEETEQTGVITYFQRYAGESLVVYGSHYMPKGCPVPPGAKHTAAIQESQEVRDLLTGKPVKVAWGSGEKTFRLA